MPYPFADQPDLVAEYEQMLDDRFELEIDRLDELDAPEHLVMVAEEEEILWSEGD